MKEQIKAAYDALSLLRERMRALIGSQGFTPDAYRAMRDEERALMRLVYALHQ